MTTSAQNRTTRPPDAAVHPRRWAVLAAIGAGGALGGAARHEIGLAVPSVTGGFPWATFLVNVTGSLALGLLVTLVIERWPPTRYVRPFAGIGLLGGYTTWSTFMTDSTLLVRDGYLAMALAYVAATLVGGLAATVAGIRLGRLWPGADGLANVPDGAA